MQWDHWQCRLIDKAPKAGRDALGVERRAVLLGEHEAVLGVLLVPEALFFQLPGGVTLELKGTFIRIRPLGSLDVASPTLALWSLDGAGAATAMPTKRLTTAQHA